MPRPAVSRDVAVLREVGREFLHLRVHDAVAWSDHFLSDAASTLRDHTVDKATSESLYRLLRCCPLKTLKKDVRRLLSCCDMSDLDGLMSWLFQTGNRGNGEECFFRALRDSAMNSPNCDRLAEERESAMMFLALHRSTLKYATNAL